MHTNALKYIVMAAAAVLIAAGAAMTLSDNKENTPVAAGETVRSDFQLFAMDTACAVTLYGDLGDDTAEQNEVRGLIKQLDEALSAYGEGNGISRINAGETVIPDEYTAEVIFRAVELNGLYPEVDCTAGRLIDLWNVNGDDPTVPSDECIAEALATVGSGNIVFAEDGSISVSNGAAINLGCCAKGYALDKVSELLEQNGSECAVVSFGSSVLLYGKKPDGSKFKVSVADPGSPFENVLNVTLDSCFLSTSGGYERFFEADGKRYSHIFDLTTGYPAETDLTSVTVISDNGMLTDFLSTCIFIGGTEELGRYLENSEILVIAIDNKGNIYCSEELKDDIEIVNTDYHLSE